MGWLKDIVDVGSGVLDWFQSEENEDAVKDQADAQAAEYKRVAEENAKLSRYDASTVRESALRIRNNTERKKELYYLNLDAILGTQKKGFADRGVVVGTGTPLDVQVETGRRMARDTEIIVNNGRTAEQQAYSLAKRFDMLADAGLREAAGVAYLVEKAADQAVENIRWDKYATSIQSSYDLGKEWGWWS